MRLVFGFLAVIAATPVGATNFAANGIGSCEVYAFYLAHPEAVTVELNLKLSLVEAVAEATGLPRGSFKWDFASACKENPQLTPDEVIKQVFDKYRGL